ncbi:Serine carboxypeptidase [Musa troglodytarum]|uniref:Carboxypeptidase n=1 Tax=Musa troglodytarum TaxID=320322 RepID=A0A9E7JWN1_9LILI|nr:Serine carboxypeptidase [Musa troglodytarum]
MPVLEKSFSLFLFISSFAVDAARGFEPNSQREADRVTELPGQPEVEFRHYAGYVRISDDKALFYWFFEAKRKPEEKPLILWLNGVWRDTFFLFLLGIVANLLFLEAPVAGGFSYTNRSSDLEELGDRITAQDSHSFLLNWFDKFPNFKSHEFFIAGESYAGHYVPQLAELIHEGNKKASKGSYINLRGFMYAERNNAGHFLLFGLGLLIISHCRVFSREKIGNAVLNDATDQLGMVEYAWSHAIISDELHASLRRECNSFEGAGEGKACLPAVKAFLRAFQDIDIYSIYSPVCLSSPSRSPRSSKLAAAPRLFSQHETWHGMRRATAGYDPCTEDYVKRYFNREDVQLALHAIVTHLSYPYSACSEIIRRWNDSPPTVLPILRKLMKAGLRVWVYSGDADARVPVTSTRYSVNEMRLRQKGGERRKRWGGWRAWYYREEVAGWVEEYEEGLTLVTVRGAGHQVPLFAPDRALALLSHLDLLLVCT